MATNEDVNRARQVIAATIERHKHAYLRAMQKRDLHAYVAQYKIWHTLRYQLKMSDEELLSILKQIQKSWK